MSTPGEDAAAAEFAIHQRVRGTVAAARDDLANALAAQLMGDDGEAWLRRCYARLESLTDKELRFAVVLAMSGRAHIDATTLVQQVRQ